MDGRGNRSTNHGCRFSIFVHYLTLPGGHQQICGASARLRTVDGREVELCDAHFAEAMRALASGSTGALSFADGPDGGRIVVVQWRPIAP
ncbi:MAG TPA: hypothetical protein VIP78_05005 [Candidatus Dormibacteraeota bacterium]